MKRLLLVLGAGALLSGAAVSGQDMPPMGQPGEEKPGLPRPIQSILLNRQVKAGELTLFADRNDDRVFYYLPDKPRLALHPNGAPQMSFLRWVKNDPSKPEGDGGGILHAVVRMGVTDEQLQAARAEVQGIKAGARIAGPVMFTSGTFGLVTSFMDKDGKKSRKIVGLGKAPLLDGQHAAVSIELDRQDSQLLWETFKSPTPDLSFSFEMELTGMHQPYRAVLEADWDKVYKHTAFDAGIAHRYLGAEIHLAFENLRQTGAIKLEQDGTDPQWDARVQSAYNILASMMFDRTVPQDPNAPMTAQPMPAPMTEGGANEKGGVYERAAALLATARTSGETARQKNAEIREHNKGVRERNAKRIAHNEKIKAAGDGGKKLEAAEKALAAAEVALQAAEKEASGTVPAAVKAELEAAEQEVKKLEAAGGQPAPGGQPGGGSPDLAKAEAALKAEETKAKTTYAEAVKLSDELKGLTAIPDEDRKPEQVKRIAELEAKKAKLTALMAAGKKVEQLKSTGGGGGGTPSEAKPDPDHQKKLDAAKARRDAAKKKVDEAAKPTEAQKKKLETAQAEVSRLKGAVEAAKAGLASDGESLMELEPEKPELKEDSVPPFAVLASFRMKRERRSGKFRIDLNKYTASSLTMRFDGNIGDVRRLLNTDHFRMVNLDDPLYKQREVVAYVDGDLNATDFGRYVNYITVQLRKTHAKGDVTDEQIRVDRTTFTGAGNNFKMLYGWKDDNDRRRWLEYEYRTVWSFFGGRQVEHPWRKAQDAAIPLAPPFLRRVVDIDISPDLVEKEGLRAVTVKVFYDLGAGEQVKQITLNTFRKDSPLSGQVEFMLPANRPEYAYEVAYQVKGNRTVTSGRERTSSGALILEELPRP